jgi:hypothetical protein
MKNINELVFPIIWQKRTQHYTSENLFFDHEVYNKYLKHDEKELDKIWENRFNISLKNLEILRRLANKLY